MPWVSICWAVISVCWAVIFFRPLVTWCSFVHNKHPSQMQDVCEQGMLHLLWPPVSALLSFEKHCHWVYMYSLLYSKICSCKVVCTAWRFEELTQETQQPTWTSDVYSSLMLMLWHVGSAFGQNCCLLTYWILLSCIWQSTILVSKPD